MAKTLFTCVGLLVLLCFPGCSKQQEAATSSQRPNIIVIVSDDQRYDQFTPEVMPVLTQHVASRGISFDRAYITNPACCPSRSTILTGMYNSKNGVYGNRYALKKDVPTIAHLLQEAGYYTGLVGKFLNSWDGSPRPEYNYWFSHRGAMVEYHNPTFNDNGTFRQFSGYVTHVLFDKATKFIADAAESEKPFFLFLTPNAPHEPAEPEAQYKHLFDQAPLVRPANYNKKGTGKPEHVSRLKALPLKKQKNIDRFYQDQLSTLRSLDDGIQRLLDALEKSGQISHTAIFFISDNGVFLGEFRLKGKSKVYEPAIHVPMVFRYDRLKMVAPVRSNALVGNLDIAPTVLELAGLPIPDSMDGHSLLPLCQKKADKLRDSLLIESWGNRRLRGNKGFMALHTGDNVYVENEDDINEFYELTSDPLQMRNQAPDPLLAPILRKKQNELHALVASLRGSVSYAIDAEEVPGFGGTE